LGERGKELANSKDKKSARRPNAMISVNVTCSRRIGGRNHRGLKMKELAGRNHRICRLGSIGRAFDSHALPSPNTVPGELLNRFKLAGRGKGKRDYPERSLVTCIFPYRSHGRRKGIGGEALNGLLKRLKAIKEIAGLHGTPAQIVNHLIYIHGGYIEPRE